MNSHFTYLLVDLGCLIVPFLFSFHPAIRFHKQWTALIVGLIVMMSIFIPWDCWFTHHGIWSFNEKYTLGIFLFNLPIEEWLFFICIPYACLFTYHCITHLRFYPAAADRILTLFAWLLFAVALIIAVVFHAHWYTFSAHALAALLLLLHLTVWKSNYLNRFIFMYILVLPAFITSNGILTGLNFLKYPFINTQPVVTDQVVWYHKDHYLGVRLFSIPMDDIAYGFSMLLLTVTVFSWVQKRRKLL